MFRKLTAAASSLMSSGSSNSDAAKIRQLTSMGFPEAAATQALAATSGNVDRAAELLLSQQATTTSMPPAAATATEDEQLRLAMEASLRSAAASSSEKQRSAATVKAGHAALQRLNTKSPPSSGNSSLLSEHHPAVKVVPMLSEKPTEERILRTADRLKNSYAAVDTLLKALTAVQQNPNNSKFRTIDTTNAGFQRSVASAPGAMDFLQAMQYRPVGHRLVMDASMVDPALLYLGMSALEQTKLTPEYRIAKGQAVFAKQIEKIRGAADSSEQEAIQRAGYLSKCPTEPSAGRGANVQVNLGEEVVRRRFEGDDTLHDVMHWLGAHGSHIFQNLEKGEWVLLDVHRNVVLNAQRQANDTLQYLECWPSGRLQLTTSELVELQGVKIIDLW